MQPASRGTDSRKLVTTAVALGMVLLVAWVLVLSQAKSGTESSNSFEQSRIDSLRTALGRDQAAAPDSGKKPDPFANAWLVFLFLGSGLAGVWWFFGRKAPVREIKPPFPVLVEQDLGGGQRLIVLEAGPEYWILSASATQTSLLFRSDKSAAPWIATLARPTDSADAFASVLKAITGDKNRK